MRKKPECYVRYLNCTSILCLVFILLSFHASLVDDRKIYAIQLSFVPFFTVTFILCKNLVTIM
jgi:hypothetical protein